MHKTHASSLANEFGGTQGMSSGTVLEEGSFVAKVLKSTTVEEFDQLINENEDLIFDLVCILSLEVSFMMRHSGQYFVFP